MSDPADDVSIDLPEQTAPESVAHPARVVLAKSALDEMVAHAADEDSHEIGGILVGTVAQDTVPVVIIESTIRGAHMTHTRGSVTFTHESWNEINRAMDEQFADKKIVGWYHSHPGFGVFLSEYDLFIHRNFFTAPWQVAFVTDPKAGQCGVFTWQSGELKLDPNYYIFGPAASMVPSVGGGSSSSVAVAPDAPPGPPGTATDPAGPQAKPGGSSAGLLWALALVALATAFSAGLSWSGFSGTVRIERRLADLDQTVLALRTELGAMAQGSRAAERGEAGPAISHSPGAAGEQPAAAGKPSPDTTSPPASGSGGVGVSSADQAQGTATRGR
jgi:proteasome lid subunit RPN8/RPN11